MKRAVTSVFAIGLSVVLTRTAAAAPVSINVGSISGGAAVLHAPGTRGDEGLGSFESYCVDLRPYDLPGASETVVNTVDNFTVLSGAGNWVSSNVPYVLLADQYPGTLQSVIASGSFRGNADWVQRGKGRGHNPREVVAPVPEPGTLVLLAAGLACGAFRRRAKSSSHGSA